MDFQKLSITQAQLLQRALEEGFVVARGRSEGSSIKELHRKKYIYPLGKVGRAVRWMLTKDLTPEEKATILEITSLNFKPERLELVERLNKSIETLYPILKKRGLDLGVFLHQSISMRADSYSLKAIIKDIDDWIHYNHLK